MSRSSANHTESDDYPAGRFIDSRTIRRTTKLELGLAILLGTVLAAVVTFGVEIRSSVNTMRDDLTDALGKIERIQAQAPELAVLRYRVEQLERRAESRP